MLKKFIDKLQMRGIPKVVAIYVASCWGGLQVIDFFSHRYGWPDVFIDVSLVLVVSGLIFICIRLWFHGEEGPQKTSKVELVLLSLNALASLFIFVVVLSTTKATVHQTDEKPPKLKSIVILPFKSSGPTEKEDEYFLDGFTSTIITSLTKTKELSVISEPISFSYKGKDDNFKVLLEELKVDYVVQGHLHRVNDKIQISLRLTDLHTGFQLWAEQFERNRKDIFEVQDEVLLGILKALGLKQATKGNNLGSEITESIEAYEFYLKGKFYSNSETVAELDTSIFYFNKAIAVDPKFALAYAEVSYVYGLKNFWFDPKGGWDERAIIAAEKALTLNRNLPEAIFARAFCNWTLKNNFPHETVIRECNRALALSPSLDRIHNHLGLIYLHVGLLEEGLAEAKIASSINPYSGFDLGTQAFAYISMHQYTEALYALKKIPENFLAFPFRKSFRAITLINLGREDEAEKFLIEALSLDPENYATNGAYAILLAKKGDRPNAMSAIKIVEDAKIRANHFHHATYNIGVAYALLGEKEKSVYWLKWSAENGFPSYSTFKEDPLLKTMQDYPPFVDFLSNLKAEMAIYKKMIQERKQ
jgi:TolB-like protein